MSKSEVILEFGKRMKATKAKYAMTNGAKPEPDKIVEELVEHLTTLYWGMGRLFAMLPDDATTDPSVIVKP